MVSFNRAEFSGGTVSFNDAHFTTALVTFGDAVFSGGEVDFSNASDWSVPPTFPWTETPPSGDGQSYRESSEEVWHGGAKNDRLTRAARRVVTTVRDNTARLREIVSARGWPGRSLVGEDGATAAWLLLQHTNSRVTTIRSAEGDEFCRSCVTLLRETVAQGEAHPRHLAAVADSLRLSNNQPPEFASLPEQYPIDLHGQAAIQQDVDLAAIDERRATIGLRPLTADIARHQESGSINEIGSDQWEPWPTHPSGQSE